MDKLADTTYIFTIFFLTLGPLKVIPTFYRQTQSANAKFRWQVAVRATVLSCIIVLLLALLGRLIVINWGISLNALKIAAGLLLLIAALGILSKFTVPKRPKSQPLSPPPSDEEIMNLAISPITIPAIITPYGVAAILLFMGNAQGKHGLELVILGLLLLMMGLNFVSMLFARQIIHRLNLVTLLLIGWIFAVMQAALAIEAIIGGLQGVGIFKPI